MADWTQAEIDSLRAAVATGVLSVRFDGPPGRTVVYQSLDAMRKLLAEMEAQAAAASPSYPGGYRLMSVRKGT